MAMAASTGAIAFYILSKYFKNNLLFGLSFVAMVGVFLIVGFDGYHGISTARFGMWQDTFDWIGLTFSGKGLGYFAANFPNYSKPNNWTFISPHNSFISLYVAFGFVGLGIGFKLLSRALKQHNRVATSGLFTAFVLSYGVFTFHVTTLAMVALIYYTICLKSSSQLKALKYDS